MKLATTFGCAMSVEESYDLYTYTGVVSKWRKTPLSIRLRGFKWFDARGKPITYFWKDDETGKRRLLLHHKIEDEVERRGVKDIPQLLPDHAQKLLRGQRDATMEETADDIHFLKATTDAVIAKRIEVLNEELERRKDSRARKYTNAPDAVAGYRVSQRKSEDDCRLAGNTDEASSHAGCHAMSTDAGGDDVEMTSPVPSKHLFGESEDEAESDIEKYQEDVPDGDDCKEVPTGRRKRQAEDLTVDPDKENEKTGCSEHQLTPYKRSPLYMTPRGNKNSDRVVDLLMTTPGQRKKSKDTSDVVFSSSPATDYDKTYDVSLYKKRNRCILHQPLKPFNDTGR